MEKIEHYSTPQVQIMYRILYFNFLQHVNTSLHTERIIILQIELLPCIWYFLFGYHEICEEELNYSYFLFMYFFRGRVVKYNTNAKKFLTIMCRYISCNLISIILISSSINCLLALFDFYREFYSNCSVRKFIRIYSKRTHSPVQHLIIYSF